MQSREGTPGQKVGGGAGSLEAVSKDPRVL